MKSIKVTNVGDIKNELRKYKFGKKLDINQFNQVARLAWLGNIVMHPLDREDAETEAFLLYCDFPEGIAGREVDIDEELLGNIHILDGKQAAAIEAVARQGFVDREYLYKDLNRRDFYLDYYEGTQEIDR